MRSGSGAPERVSIRALRPSVQPNCAKPCRERRYAGLKYRIICGRRRRHADVPHPLRLLPTLTHRPSGCRAAEQRDELAPVLTELHAGSPRRAGAAPQDIELAAIS
jgi:hypothetical protein